MLDKIKLKKQILEAIQRAEGCWKKTGGYFELSGMRKIAKARVTNMDESNIPGFEKLKWDDFDKGSFIAMFADMRDSSTRFTQALSKWTPAEKRVLFETLSMSAMFDYVINHHNGVVTEFLGDGCLALYHLPDDINEKERTRIFKEAWAAANDLVSVGLEVLNECLDEIGIPNVKIGVGVACSKAVVVRVGSSDNQMPKIIGACVYKASKLSQGENEVIVDKSFDVGWPGQSGGTLSFKSICNSKIAPKNREFILPMKSVVTAE